MHLAAWARPMSTARFPRICGLLLAACLITLAAGPSPALAGKQRAARGKPAAAKKVKARAQNRSRAMPRARAPQRQNTLAKRLARKQSLNNKKSRSARLAAKHAAEQKTAASTKRTSLVRRALSWAIGAAAATLAGVGVTSWLNAQSFEVGQLAAGTFVAAGAVALVAARLFGNSDVSIDFIGSGNSDSKRPAQSSSTMPHAAGSSGIEETRPR